MNNLLVQDKIMNGLITNLIEEAWNKNKEGKNKFITFNEMQDIHEALVNYDNDKNEIFGQLAMYISTPTNVRECSVEECVDFFDVPGFILDDGIYASTFGQFNYVYRSKGERSVWFKNGLIDEYSVFCIIDENGFNLCYEKVDGIDIYTSRDFFNDVDSEYVSACDKYIDPVFLINKLISINKYYNKSYYLEYLINPPDVQILSNYSLELKKEIWNSILELGIRVLKDKKDDELNLFKFCISFMREVNCNIEAEQIIDFFMYIMENKNDLDLGLVLNLLQELKSVNKEELNFMNEIADKIDSATNEDIIELRPNVGGIGINFNAILKKIFKK
ncbi:hypothetical protein FDF86_11715 [Clostridium botulinum]|nr:hypothetical protein [Clostridium botulinum]